MGTLQLHPVFWSTFQIYSNIQDVILMYQLGTILDHGNSTTGMSLQCIRWAQFQIMERIQLEDI